MIVKELKIGKSIKLFNTFKIRLIQSGDLSKIKIMLNDPRVHEYLFYAPAPDEIYEQYFQPMIDDIESAVKEKKWADNLIFIIEDEKEEFAGMIGLSQVAFHAGNFEVGFQIPSRYWRKGIASKACSFISNLAFENFGAHKITADCYASNRGSYGVLLKCGYYQEGISKGYYKSSMGQIDKLYFGINMT
ncbi:GNAT family N-acetyltransferase [bacterium]|nr:GNAT family N-acetyltransferase [bacterium]